MSIIGRLFGARRHATPAPTPEQVASVDVAAMIATARERGDIRDDQEVVASLILGAELTAERHHDPDIRSRAAAAAVATSRWLVERVGEDRAADLLAASDGPIDAHGRIRRAPR